MKAKRISMPFVLFNSFLRIICFFPSVISYQLFRSVIGTVGQAVGKATSMQKEGCWYADGGDLLKVGTNLFRLSCNTGR